MCELMPIIRVHNEGRCLARQSGQVRCFVGGDQTICQNWTQRWFFPCRRPTQMTRHSKTSHCPSFAAISTQSETFYAHQCLLWANAICELGGRSNFSNYGAVDSPAWGQRHLPSLASLHNVVARQMNFSSSGEPAHRNLAPAGLPCLKEEAEGHRS
jgi:hypothetical protein